MSPQFKDFPHAGNEIVKHMFYLELTCSLTNYDSAAPKKLRIKDISKAGAHKFLEEELTNIHRIG